MALLTIILGVFYGSAALFAATSGILVAISLFIADRAPQNMDFLALHLIIGGLFLAIAFLLAGIAWQMITLSRMVDAGRRVGVPADLGSRVFRLELLLTVAGCGLSGLFGFALYGIASRIDQGFAVFG